MVSGEKPQLTKKDSPGNPDPALVIAEEFGTRTKRERVPADQPANAERHQRTATGLSPPLSSEATVAPLDRAALHAPSASPVALYRSSGHEAAVEFGTRLPDLGLDSGHQPRDFPTRKSMFV